MRQSITASISLVSSSKQRHQARQQLLQKISTLLHPPVHSRVFLVERRKAYNAGRQYKPALRLAWICHCPSASSSLDSHAQAIGHRILENSAAEYCRRRSITVFCSHVAMGPSGEIKRSVANITGCARRAVRAHISQYGHFLPLSWFRNGDKYSRQYRPESAQLIQSLRLGVPVTDLHGNVH